MPCHSTNGFQGTFAPADAHVEFGAVARVPARLIVVGRYGVGGLDESPFQVLVAFGAYAPVVGLATAGAHARGGAAAIQYQLPTLSRAIGVPGREAKKVRRPEPLRRRPHGAASLEPTTAGPCPLLHPAMPCCTAS